MNKNFDARVMYEVKKIELKIYSVYFKLFVELQELS